MPSGLLPRLRSRVILVVGKGGVGKSTVAGGLALALADAGETTHLLSTDPAHSVGDLFGQPLGGDPAASRCTPRLTLEELDAATLVRDRLDDLIPGLRELIDRGTYLDAEDADSLLSASLPGLDEVAAALRIAALDGPRLVVDTAPTGHTLRLLETPDLIRGWLHVFDAMAAKADTVASALLGRDVRLTVEDRLEELAAEARTFQETAAAADFLVVTATGEVVEAETRRLRAALEERGFRVAATVAVEPGSPLADRVLPRRRELSGCAALRSWWADVEAGGTGPDHGGTAAAGSGKGTAAGLRAGAGREREDAGAGPPAWSPELERPLVVFTGKGGVGKSTCAAALAVARASAGDRVLLLGADPAGSLEDVLAGSHRDVPGLELREMDADAELERFRDRYRAEVERVFEAVGLDRSARMDRAVIESLWLLAPPGLDELMAVSRLAEAVDAGTHVVLDTAPTGHFLRLAAMPGLALDWVRRIMRILLKYGAIGDIDAPAAELLGLGKRFRALRDRLEDPAQSAVVVVTLDQPMVRAETDRLVERLAGLGLPPAGLLVNRATGSVAGQPDRPVWRAPEVAEPRGAAALREFTRAWERAT